MRYYVIAPDGSRFGPADLALLNRWISEGRVLSSTPLIFEATGEHCLAGQIPGLAFASPPVGYALTSPPIGYEHAPMAYPHQWAPPSGDTGAGDISRAWVMFALGLTCCSVTFISGFLAAQSARRKGHPGAPLAMMANAVVGGITIIFFIWFLTWVLGSAPGL